MPDNVQNRPIHHIRQILRTQNLDREQISQIVHAVQALRNSEDLFMANNILNQAMNGLDPALQILIRAQAAQIIPPPRLPAGVRPEDVDDARIRHGWNRPDQVDNAWAAQMVALAGAEFDVDAYNPQRLVGDALRFSGFTERPGNIGAAQSQGAALARNFWSDGFASSIELASAFMYAQNLPDDQKAGFQNSFAREFANQVRTRYQDPQRQRYIMMQMTRFLANTNWAGNNGFRDFISSITNEMANSLPAYQGLRDQLDRVPQNQRAVVQTYDLPGENNTYGAAVMLAYRDNNGNIRTEVVRHRPGLDENLWRFNFPPMPATAPQAVPGAGGGPGVPAVVNPGAGDMPTDWSAAPGAPAPAAPVTPTPVLVFQRRDRDTVGGYVQTPNGTQIYTTGTDENGRHVNGFEIAPDGTRTETSLLPASSTPQRSLLRPEEARQHLQLLGTSRIDSAGRVIYERAGFVGNYIVRDNGTVYFAGGYHRNGADNDIPLPSQTYINGRWYQGNVSPQAAPVAPPGAAPGAGAQGAPAAPPPAVPATQSIPGNRSPYINLGLQREYAALQTIIQHIKDRGTEGPAVSENLRDLEEISNQLGVFVTRGAPDEAEQARQISNRLNQFHNRISQQDNGVLTDLSEEIRDVSNNLNQIAGRIVQSNFHTNVRDIGNNFGTTLNELTTLFTGAISQEQRERGENIRTLLTGLARPNRPPDTPTLERVASEITVYANGLQGSSSSRTPGITAMYNQALRLREIANGLRGTSSPVPNTPPPD